MSKLQSNLSSDDEKQSEDLQQNVRRIWYCGAWRTPEAVERKRLKAKLRSRERYKNPEYVAAQRQRNKARRAANREKFRQWKSEYYQRNKERLNAERIARANKDREKTNANQRACYERNREQYLAAERARRDKRRPDRVIRRLQKSLCDGSIGLDQFVKEIKQQVDGFNERLRERLGSRQVEGGGLESGESPDRDSNSMRERPHDECSDTGGTLKGRDGSNER